MKAVILLISYIDDGPYKVSFSLKGLPIVSEFVARDEELDILKQSLLPKPTRIMRRKVHVVHGLGGIGKTQLAIEYARQHQRIYSSVFWLRGNSKDEVRQSIAQIAYQIPAGQIPDSSRQVSNMSVEELDIVIRDVLQWFSSPSNHRWLIIFDNVDRGLDPELNDHLAFAVTDYLPDADHGSILITSRLRKLAEYGTHLKLSRMNEQQGKDVLEKKRENRLKVW